NVYDEGDDGLSFWANSDGTGFCELRVDSTDALIERFDPDFGDNIRYHFSIGDSIHVDPVEPIASGSEVFVYPNPSKGTVHVAINNLLDRRINVEVFNLLGQQVVSTEEITIETPTELMEVDLTGLVTGLYVIKVISGDDEWVYRVQKI
ncbi:MAG: T9SS type A sorting domain-containing protein, partial [Bacteroidia bacterium]|nr:T9SS type A sorting domain-containing protein [Bacteroidia bacterium]